MSDTITVRFSCGHAQALESTADLSSVRCAVCGQTRVRSVAAPPPRFVAVDCDAQGPCVVKGS